MSENEHVIKETTTRHGDTVSRTQRVHDASAEAEHTATKVSRLIWWVAGAIITLLVFRFVLTLLGANPSNPFADLVYTISYPFVAPFFGLFAYDHLYGVSKLEVFTLVAIAFYAFLAWGIAKLATINRPPEH